MGIGSDYSDHPTLFIFTYLYVLYRDLNSLSEEF
jgi:hypothetical protein